MWEVHYKEKREDSSVYMQPLTTFTLTCHYKHLCEDLFCSSSPYPAATDIEMMMILQLYRNALTFIIKLYTHVTIFSPTVISQEQVIPFCFNKTSGLLFLCGVKTERRAVQE